MARLLAKQPGERPGSAAGVLLVATALVWARNRGGSAPARAPDSTGTRSLAVLPLTRIGGDSTDDYFGDGIADELISTLGRMPGLRVASRTSSFALRGGAGDLREIGERLNVQHVLEGSVQRTRDRVRVMAIRYFGDAIARDSSYAQAWAGLATAWAMSAPFAGGEPHEVFPKALRATERALALDSTAADAHTARAVIAMFYEWDLPLAGREFERSIALNPSDAEAHLFYHWYLATQGRMAESRAQIETAAALDPLSVITATRRGTLAWIEGRNADAEKALREALQIDSTFYMARGELSVVLLALGKRDAARAVLPPADEILPGSVESAFPAIARAGLGDTAGVRRTRAAIDALRGQRYVATDLRAAVTLVLGDVAGALDQLERAVDERAFTLIFLGIYPPWKALASEPRFQRLLARIGLPPVS